MTDYVEKDCKFEFQGKSFESGGAYIVGDTACVYVNDKRQVTDWHGTVLGAVRNLKIGDYRYTQHGRWRMAYCEVVMDGRVWWGRWNFDAGNAVRLKARKS